MLSQANTLTQMLTHAHRNKAHKYSILVGDKNTVKKLFKAKMEENYRESQPQGNSLKNT